MFASFTDRSRHVMALANRESQRLNLEYIGTEHVLLGLVEEGSGVVANVLRNLGVDLRKVVGLEAEQITHAVTDETTKLPEHLQPHWDEPGGTE